MNASRLLKGAASALSVGVVSGGLLVGSSTFGAARAAVVTIDFTGLWGQGQETAPYPGAPWLEDGFTVGGQNFQGFPDGIYIHHSEPGHPLITDGGTAFPSGLHFSVTGGGLFDAQSLQYRGGGYGLIRVGDPAAGTDHDETANYPNLRFTGLLSGATVAQETLTVPNSAFVGHTLGSAFSAIDTLTVMALLPPAGAGFILGFCSPCSQFHIDNVVLALNAIETPAPIPVPAAIWLMGTALAGLGWYGRRRKST